MSDIFLRGSASRSTATPTMRHGHPAAGRPRGWWPHLRDRLMPERTASDEDLNDRLLEDIGLSRADLAALRL